MKTTVERAFDDYCEQIGYQTRSSPYVLSLRKCYEAGFRAGLAEGRGGPCAVHEMLFERERKGAQGENETEAIGDIMDAVRKSSGGS